MKYYGRLFGEARGKRTRYWDTGKTGQDWENIEQERDGLREKIRLTLMENPHLAAGDVCTLKRLKDAIGFDLDSPNEPCPSVHATE